MPRQTIASQLLDAKDTSPRRRQGGNMHIDDALARKGWDSTDPDFTVVVSSLERAEQPHNIAQAVHYSVRALSHYILGSNKLLKAFVKQMLHTSYR